MTMTLEQALAASDPGIELIVNDYLEIDGITRVINIPSTESLFGIENDDEGEKKYFKSPRFVGNDIDLLKSNVYIKYKNANGQKDRYIVTDVKKSSDERYVIFTWSLSQKATMYKGDLKFLVCVKQTTNSTIKEWNTEIASGAVKEGLEVQETEDDQKKSSDYLEQMKQVLSDKAKEVAETIPSDYRELNDNVDALKNDVSKLKENIGGSLKPTDVQGAVDKYLESNTIDGLFTPNNIVLCEQAEEDEMITADTIIGEVLAKLELRATDNQALGLYLGDTLINSILLEEFRANEVICTGISLAPAKTTVYGKATVELIATVQPLDCTQKIRWFSADEQMASVSNGTVLMTGKAGTVEILAVCGNYRATSAITVEQYVYTDFDWKIGVITETLGSAYSRPADSQKMRIASAYIATPLDTEVIMTGGSAYRYAIYYYKVGKLVLASPGWADCSGTIVIKASEYDGFALKIMRKGYAAWDDSVIEVFGKTITIQNM